MKLLLVRDSKFPQVCENTKRHGMDWGVWDLYRPIKEQEDLQVVYGTMKKIWWMVKLHIGRAK